MLNRKHYNWHVRTQQEGEHFRVYYQHHYPNEIVEETRDPRRFNSLEEAEQFAKNVRRTNRIFTELCAFDFRFFRLPLFGHLIDPNRQVTPESYHTIQSC